MTFHEKTVIGLGLIVLATLALTHSIWACVLLAAVVYARDFGTQLLKVREAERLEAAERRHLDEASVPVLTKKLADEAAARERLEQKIQTLQMNIPRK